MGNELTGIFCPRCDKIEQGQTQSRMLNKQSGWVCTVGHKFKSYIELSDMNPRKLKLAFQEKQPANTEQHPFWIYPEALAALKSRFPTNLRTTICALFNALADTDTILIEGEHTRELRQLNVQRGRDMVGLAKTNIALAEQIKVMEAQMRQYEGVQRLFAAAGMSGGLGAAEAQPGAPDALGVAALAALMAGNGTGAGAGMGAEPKLPAPRPVIPAIDPDAEHTYYDAVAGSFSDPELASPTQRVVVLGKPVR